MKKQLLYSLFLFLIVTFGYSQVNSVAIVGEAAGGWPGEPGNPGPIDVHQMTTTDGTNWFLSSIVLTNAATNGGIKFRANNDWAINWGNTVFPTSTGTLNGPNILCTAGNYSVTFNSTTGAYSFTLLGAIPIVKLVGTAVPNIGELTLTTSDAINFIASNITLIAGNGQFSINGILSGNNSFPSGVLLNSTTQIPVTAGTYSTISLNINTGAYSFILSPIPTIAIVGEAAGGWPGSPGYPSIDLNQMITSDGTNYKINSVFLSVGAIKFRANNNWTTSWGGISFPSGPQVGGEASNINVTTAGNYRAVLNRNTGVYTFDLPSISIVGEAVGGWPGDPGNPGPIDIHQLTTTDGETYTINNLAVTTAITNGGVKFRQDNDWSINWGNNTFPSATSSNGSNIPTVAGIYNVTFTRSTGAYSFINTLSINDIIKNDLQIYPNPANTNWNIYTSYIIDTIELFDITGKSIETFTPRTNTFKIEGINLREGIYFLKIKSGLDIKIKKIIKI